MHRHHHPETCEICEPWPDWARHILARLTVLEMMAMTEINDQQHLEADVAAENDALTKIEAEIAALKAQPGAEALDFTSLDAATARLTADAPADSTPTDPTPTPPAA